MNVLWTIGHWTCPEPVFIGRLDEHNIQLIVDVRAQPGSRKSPQYGQDQMRGWLEGAGLGYLHRPDLGGRRKPQHADPSLNGAWRNASFHNYADYTLTAEFEAGLSALVAVAQSSRVAVLCGEPMPWRCHRSLISTVLTARGWTVRHILTDRTVTHELGKWGPHPHVANGQVTYPAPDAVT